MTVNRLCVIGLVAACLAVVAPAASATNRIYWTNFQLNGSIAFSNLDGSGSGGSVNVGGASVIWTAGVGIDPAANKVYWANYDPGNTISFANLDESGAGGKLNTSSVTPNKPAGVAVDAALGRIYWADMGDNKIEFANLNGTGGGVLNTGLATVNGPEGVAVDHATGKVYWANFTGNKISFANLDDSGGGGDLNTTGVVPTKPIGVAIDPATGQIFWANYALGAGSISFANLNDTGGGGTLVTTGTTPKGPQGVAIDPAGGRIYWANFDGATIAFANVTGGGGGTVNTGGMPPNFPVFPALLEAPLAAGAPAVTGRPAAPTTLLCTSGNWGPDLPESLLYQAPQRFSYSWTNDGAAIPGATSNVLSAPSGGNYSCHVTAQNQAGSTVQASGSYAVAPTAQLGGASISGNTATFKIVCEGVSSQVCSGSVVGTVRERKRGSTILGVSARRKKKPKLTTSTVTVAKASYLVRGGQSVNLRIALNRSGGRLLTQFYRLPVKLAFSGSTNQTKTVTYVYPVIRSPINFTWAFTPSFAIAQQLSITGIPSGGKVTVICHGGGCPFRKRKFSPHHSRVSLTSSLHHSNLRPGATLELEITASNQVGKVATFTIRSGQQPRLSESCLPPGARGPTRCV